MTLILTLVFLCSSTHALSQKIVHLIGVSKLLEDSDGRGTLRPGDNCEFAVFVCDQCDHLVDACLDALVSVCIELVVSAS